MSIPPDLPKSVQNHVRYHLSRLREHERALNGVVAARGKGHILALELRDRIEDIESNKTSLAEFRELASKNGVDGDHVINELGGEPSFEQFGQSA